MIGSPSHEALGLGRLLGQPRATRILGSLLAARQFPPLLLTGQPGTGKRTAALLIAQAALCEKATGCGACPSCIAVAHLRHPDVRLIMPIPSAGSKSDPAPEEAAEKLLTDYPGFALGSPHPPVDPHYRIGIQLIRWIRSEMAKPPAQARTRFVIVLHADRLGSEGAAALLKVLEEPHQRTAIILTTDRPALLTDTVRSRCRVVRFADLNPNDIRAWLKRNTDAEAVDMAVEAAVGSLGRALSALDQDLAGAKRAAETYYFALLGGGNVVPAHAVAGGSHGAEDGPPDSLAMAILLTNRSSLRSNVQEGAGPRGRLAVELELGRLLLGRLSDLHLRINPTLAASTLDSGLRGATQAARVARKRMANRP